ncbi:MAG: hypothetical protein K6E62_12425 [Lachnospiraceae bacterium]|nr:hypothetical protein [Lachnospiraceae bacterium]
MKKFLKVLGIIALVVFAAIISLMITNHFTNRSVKLSPQNEVSADDFPTTGVPAVIQEENDEQLRAYLESLKEQPSDIQGWSLYDKYIYGLQLEDESDTDKDGLTDQEELEIYDSDPLKISSADDLYTDGEKVEGGVSPATFVDIDEKDKYYRDGAFTIYRSSPWDFIVSVVDMTEKYRDPGATPSTKLPAQFYYAYKICNFDGDRIDVDLNEFASRLGMNAKDLDVEAHALHNNPYRKKRSGNTVTVTFQDVEPFDSGIGMKGYDLFIVKKKGLTDKISFLSSIKNTIDQWYEQNVGNRLAHRDSFGMVFIETFTFHCMNASPRTRFGKDLVEGGKNIEPEKRVSVSCVEGATEEEQQYALYAGEYLYYLVYGEPIQLNKNRDLKIESREDYDEFLSGNGESGWFLKWGLPLNAVRFLDLNLLYGKMPAKYPWFCFLWTSNGFYNSPGLREYIAQRNAIFKSNSPDFSIDDELCFSNFDTEYLVDITEEGRQKSGGVCAGIAQITAEVYNHGAVRFPSGEYSAEIRDKGEYVMQTLDYDITQYPELNTFLDCYISDYREYRGGHMEYEHVEDLKPDENEFLKMVTCYWRMVNDVYSKNVDYTDTLLMNRDGFLLDWETVENATRYLDDHQILICCMNINNIYDHGHAVNLVGYERSTETLCDGYEYESVIFDVYDSNLPKCLMKLKCYRMPAWDGHDAMLYEYNMGNDDYHSSFMLDQYTIGESEGSKCIRFVIFNDQGQCLNIKL